MASMISWAEEVEDIDCEVIAEANGDDVNCDVISVSSSEANNGEAIDDEASNGEVIGDEASNGEVIDDEASDDEAIDDYEEYSNAPLIPIAWNEPLYRDVFDENVSDRTGCDFMSFPRLDGGIIHVALPRVVPFNYNDVAHFFRNGSRRNLPFWRMRKSYCRKYGVSRAAFNAILPSVIKADAANLVNLIDKIMHKIVYHKAATLYVDLIIDAGLYNFRFPTKLSFYAMKKILTTSIDIQRKFYNSAELYLRYTFIEAAVEQGYDYLYKIINMIGMHALMDVPDDILRGLLAHKKISDEHYAALCVSGLRRTWFMFEYKCEKNYIVPRGIVHDSLRDGEYSVEAWRSIINDRISFSNIPRVQFLKLAAYNNAPYETLKTLIERL